MRKLLPSVGLFSVLFATAPHASAQSVLFDLHGDSEGDWFGGSLASFTDYDGDGVLDFLVGSPRDAGPLFHAGRVRILSGADASLLRDFSGSAVEEQYGTAVADAGDVDHDGVHDVVVGIRYWGVTGNKPGAVRVVSGANGATLYHIPGLQHASEFGFAVAGLGDVNGDTYADFAAGAPRHSGVTAGNSGIVRVFSGANGALLYALSGTQTNEFLGAAISAAGDVDFDGELDLIVGAYGNSTAGERRGMARAFRGYDGTVLHTVYGDQDFMAHGTSVGGAGDLNGDGHADFLAGTPFWGNATGGSVGLVRAYSGADASVLHEWQGAASVEGLGSAVAGGRDVTGDGVPDVVIGCFRHADFTGRVEVRSGSDGSLVYRVDGTYAAGQLGGNVALLGDLDGDNRSEFAAGAALAATTANHAGQVLVWKACKAPQTYCTAKINSLGCAPRADFIGTPSASGADDFVVLGRDVINNSNGMMIWSRAPNSTPFAGGTLCILPPIRRTLVNNAGGSAGPPQDCTGVLSFSFTHAYAAAQNVLIGDRICCQFWARDVFAPDGTGVSLSDALEFTWCP